ncbi:MAG: RNA 2',3'-cyclic phosphodiesterase [Pseudomonadota bacterium]
MEIRSFLAFELPPEIKRIVAEVSVGFKRSNLDVRWVKTENIHLTVVFLGQIEQDHLEAMEMEIQKACIKYGHFEMSLKGTGCFPNKRNPRVLWIGLHGDLVRMGYFRDALQDALSPFGVKGEKRSFRPHLTLGRFRTPDKRYSILDDLLSRHEDLSSPVFQLNELILFRSDLKPGGAEYSKLKSWTLSGKD